jgi:threonylcarbamoyladenosine tRNA methylthiotransferase MtaB
MTKYAVVTFGCRVNQADSLGFEEDLLAAGAEPSAVDAADLVIVNTCSVTGSADQGARQTIRRIARTNPSARIVITGCYATRRPEELTTLPNVIKVVSNARKPDLVQGIRLQAEFELTTADRFAGADGPCGSPLAPGVAGRTAYTLRVQTGCDEVCSYCIIPSTRGTSQSIPLREVLEQIDRVIAAGYQEVALTGVHLGSYGRDLDPPGSLADLLRALADATAGSGVLFRISSLEPMDCTPEIVSLVSSGECFAPHFHLPLQHASDRLLKAMGRPYTIRYYAALVDSIRERLPLASIGSDVIVGFPGETDEDFEALLQYLQQSPLTHIHTFPYSDRPGTAASSLPGKIAGTIIRDRAHRVRSTAAVLTDRFRAAQLGRVYRALTLDDGTLAVTPNYLKVQIPPGRLRNEWVNIRILATDPAMVGELIESAGQPPKASARR